MSDKPAYIHAPWDVDWENDVWENQRQTFQGNGMTFAELQKRYPLDHGFGREWKLYRTSKRGNRVMFGVSVQGCDNLELGYGGTAYSYEVTAIVRPDDTVAQYTVVYDEWDY